MLAETIQNPEDYLSYSKQIIYDAGIREDYPKISAYYEELCLQFETVYNNQQENPFRKWGELLRIDAQIQILLELTGLREQDWMSEFGMTEEEIIQMIRHDKDSFYRELTGGNLHEKPKWGLIYLGEE